MKSTLESLHLRDVRQFSELNVHFNAGFNFIAGPNGCGKTSILTAISHCFHYQALGYSRFGSNAEFWTDLTVDQKKYRIGLGANAIATTGYRNSSIRQWIPPSSEVDRIVLATHQAKDELKYAPLFIGAQRNIKYKQVQGLKREENSDATLNSYLTNSTHAIYGDWQSDVKQWFINRYFMIDKDWAVEERINWSHLINQLPQIGPFDSDFKYIRTGKDLEPIFSIYGKECYLEELSSGFQAVLLIIANIIEWVEGSRSDGDRVVEQAGGTVLVDELDIHLHPEWQFTIRGGLSRIFPKLQFIVTTHSPHLLASAEANEVIIMQKSSSGAGYNLRPTNRSFSGWNTDQILSEIMGVKSLDNKEHERLVAAALHCVEGRDVGGLKIAIENLSAACHPNDTILVVLKARLASLEALAND
uniref:AAA family ATPase n=1 Tax=Burkholderia anthina TaxID=179879 RepID=UPI001589429A|nr:AAA family ATPase [Burkholderia anthina]